MRCGVVLALLLAVSWGVAAIAQDAPSPAMALSPGALNNIARNPPSGATVCEFHVQGAPASSSKSVTTASIEASSVGAGLKTADIKCTGGSANITIQGGPALEPFSAGWQGVSYIKNVQLPGSTMTLRGVNMYVQDSTFVGLQSFGSAAIAFAASNVTFINATFLLNNNSAAGCVYGNESTMLTVLDSNFTSNAGLAAGAVALWNSTASVNNTVFYNNTCNSQGGALMVSNGSNIIVQQSTFQANNATNGGALYFEGCTSMSLTKNMFSLNTASKSGGAAFQLQCPGTLLSNTFLQNSGSNGGAVWHNNLKKLNHTLNLFVGNSGPKGSGGIELNQVDSMVVNNCNFTAGKGQKGGAIYTQNTGGDITNTYFAKNSASNSGGAIFRGTSSGKVSGCNFIANTAVADGAAIYDSHVDGDITSSNSFSNNTAKGSGTIFRTASSGDVETKLDASAVVNDNPAAAG